jgi:hypothetical protein
MLVDKISNHIFEDQENSVIKLQSFFRGYLAKTKAEKEKSHYLSLEIFEKAKPYIDNPSSRNDLSLATNGKTKVYLPKELPVVLKHSGSPENQKRFQQIKMARNLCIENGYEHLIIPPARVYGDFIIESKVPIKANKFKEQMGLYIENWEKFTPAVKEFLEFFFQSSFSDITGGTSSGYEALSKSPMGRYDNIALFLDGDHGKMGLIDLEHFSRAHDSEKDEDFYAFRCLYAVRLFPLHFDVIMDEAKKIDPTIELYRQRLVKERDESLKRFKIAYEDHADFIKEKGITIQNPLFFEKLSDDRIKELKNHLEKKIKKVHEGKTAYGGCYSFKDCLGEDPDKTLTEFHEKILPYFIDALYTRINFSLELNMKRYKDSADYTPGLLLIRSLEFPSRTILDKMVNPIFDHFSIFKMKDESDTEGFIYWLLDITLENMVGKEIAYYNPDFGVGSGSKRCVFC